MLSVLIITKNAQSKLKQCLNSIEKLADEIIVLDTGSTDDTIKIAKDFGAKVANSKGNNFSAWRNEAAKYAKGDWLFYIDYDEEVAAELKRELETLITNHQSPITAYRIPRKNYVFGRWLKHGGFWPDYVLRLMRKEALVRWEGKLHEQPVIKGEVGTLTNALIHHKEDSLSDMVAKTNRYSVFEAELLFKSNHPPMAWWRFVRIMGGELWFRLIVKGGILDGTEGILYGVYQMWSRFVTYAKLWEMQVKDSRRSGADLH